jgi:hypothetical protein
MQRSVFYFTAKSLYVFRVPSTHTSSAVHKSVTTATGTSHMINAATSLQRDHVTWHPKHAE